MLRYILVSFPNQVVFDTLFGSITNGKLQNQALQLVLHICTRLAAKNLQFQS